MSPYVAGALGVISALVLGAVVGMGSLEIVLRVGPFYGTVALLAAFTAAIIAQYAVTQYLWRKCEC
ncbi:TPA: hypothetical protein ACH1LG_004775 [Salmonella enterica]